MAIKLISIRCPECGASLDIEEGRKQVFCSYCGAKILVQNENEYVLRYVDDAELKQTEADLMVKMKQLDISEKKRLAEEKR